MNVAIIDADLIGRKRHRFPNLCSMKISAYHKQCGDNVELKTDYDDLDNFDKVYISKVFTDTELPEINHANVVKGGTGFYYDKAPALPDEIEHIMPDYNLYNSWLEQQNYKEHKTEFKDYTDCSIGYLTRGCFRKCKFCVNQKYDHVFKASELSEFLDFTRPRICLCDDNFFGYPGWKELLQQLIDSGKRFKFKQGLDARLMTEEKAEILFSAKYDSDIYFAFDNVADYDIIEQKIKLMRKYTDRRLIFYVFCGFDRQGKYDNRFWLNDLYDLFKRLELLGRYNCSPYIMRHKNYALSPLKGIYITAAAWCNQFSFFVKQSLKEYVINTRCRGGARADLHYLEQFKEAFPLGYEQFADFKFWG